MDVSFPFFLSYRIVFVFRSGKFFDDGWTVPECARNVDLFDPSEFVWNSTSGCSGKSDENVDRKLAR